MTRIDNTQDVMDSRDIIEHLDYLRDHTANSAASVDQWNAELGVELEALEDFVTQLEGCGDWEYGETVIRESYFMAHARELAEDCGMVQPGAAWPNNCIDWEQAAAELRMDYIEADFDGVTYLMRA